VKSHKGSYLGRLQPLPQILDYGESNWKVETEFMTLEKNLYPRQCRFFNDKH
jgi:hypothetical protein